MDSIEVFARYYIAGLLVIMLGWIWLALNVALGYGAPANSMAVIGAISGIIFVVGIVHAAFADCRKP